MNRDSNAPCMTAKTTGMAFAILAEVAQRLKTLAEFNEPSTIDLRSLPMSQADRDQLEQMLGRGEVTARLEVAGPTDIWETAYSGVWWIRHMGVGDRVATEEIAVTLIPEIFLSDPHDVANAANRLQQEIDQDRDQGSGQVVDSRNGMEAQHV